MFKWFFLSIIAVLLFFGAIHPIIAKKFRHLLVHNSTNRYKIPRNFHITPFNCSSSGQFSEKELEALIGQIPSSKIVIVDLRQEPHGFINGDAVNWYHEHNWGDIEKNTAETLHQERSMVEKVRRSFFALVHYDRRYPVPYLVKTVQTEQDLTARQNVQYIRFPITDHRRPKDRAVDAFIQWVKQKPKDLWIHFHCNAGRGRSTTFLAMYDMMLHAWKDPADAIVKRQIELGGADLFNMPNPGSWKESHIACRVSFIRQFHKYCKEVPAFDLSWSEWIEKKGIAPYN